MIKYIVTWLLLKTIPIACPDSQIADKSGRVQLSNVSCAVYHFRIEKEKLRKEFYSKDSATAFYNELLVESRKSIGIISGGIDSVEIIAGVETNNKICGHIIDSIALEAPKKSSIKRDTLLKDTPLAYSINYSTDGKFMGIRCHINDTLTELEMYKMKIKNNTKKINKKQ